LLPDPALYHPDYPPRCHRPRINDRIVFDKLLHCCGSAALTTRSPTRRLARCYGRRATVIDAYFDLADTIITLRSLIRRS
jgi:hypothetical protein